MDKLKIGFIAAIVITAVIAFILLSVGFSEFNKEKYRSSSQLLIAAFVFAICAGMLWPIKNLVESRMEPY